ncbi:hypothetical protein DXA97_02890 [Clostridium sp. OF09-36]|jgi:hypothetical protein|uniref:nitroreductase family protein n=1 Tax=Clostridium sp. OF09-36 TaxID=2292310 RepID=UPI000E4A5CDC|nr:nitroreductase family protein [Clostridium sp. OF09-36]RHV89799.1 hypothetical protein DXA97_02890 [Clostridium sp. OF09-36]HBM48383.1 hypothetical protein [Lachnoclostridium sp.]
MNIIFSCGFACMLPQGTPPNALAAGSGLVENQQKFFFELKDGTVTAKSLRGFYSKIDLGIAKYHFEAVTGHKVK